MLVLASHAFEIHQNSISLHDLWTGLVSPTLYWILYRVLLVQEVSSWLFNEIFIMSEEDAACSNKHPYWMLPMHDHMMSFPGVFLLSYRETIHEKSPNFSKP